MDLITERVLHLVVLGFIVRGTVWKASAMAEHLAQASEMNQRAIQHLIIVQAHTFIQRTGMCSVELKEIYARYYSY